MGGEYVEGNVIDVEVSKCDRNTATHAMWHYANWKLQGKVEDRLAWHALAGFLNKEEIIEEAYRIGGRLTGKLPTWTDGERERRCVECPGEGWTRGRADSVKVKVSRGRTGKKDSPEAKINKSKASKGKPKSESHRRAIRENARKGEQHPNYGKTGQDSATYGTRRTPEQIEKMSGPNHPMYGKNITEDVKRKLRQKMEKKRWWVNESGDTLFQEETPGSGWEKGRKWKG